MNIAVRMRRYSVSIRGAFSDEAVPLMKQCLEAVGKTTVENYDVYPQLARLAGVANFRVNSDASGEELASALACFYSVESIRTEEIDGKRE